MSHCKDTTGFRTRVAPHCAHDPTATACKLAIVEAARYGYGYGCLHVPLFGLDAPPYSAYVCEGVVPPQLRAPCRESGYSIPSPQPALVPENGTGSNVAVKTTAAVAPVVLVGVGVVAMRKAREKRSQAPTEPPSRIVDPNDIGRDNPDNFNADGVFLEPEPAPLVEPPRQAAEFLVSDDRGMDPGHGTASKKTVFERLVGGPRETPANRWWDGEPPTRTLRGRPIVFPTNR